jgi:hypothetical protein
MTSKELLGANVVNDPLKGTIIQATKRADGTWRKERKVREGILNT